MKIKISLVAQNMLFIRFGWTFLDTVARTAGVISIKSGDFEENRCNSAPMRDFK